MKIIIAAALFATLMAYRGCMGRASADDDPLAPSPSFDDPLAEQMLFGEPPPEPRRFVIWPGPGRAPIACFVLDNGTVVCTGN